MTEYEVKCPQTWAWYTGYVHDYDESKKKLLIKYPDEWKSAELIDISCVRYKHSSIDNNEWRPSYNEEVECKARAEEREPYGWWPCKAKKYDENDAEQQLQAVAVASTEAPSSQLYSVAFIGWGDQHNEILGIEYIRKKSSSLPLSHMKNLCRSVYLVPAELYGWVLTHCANQTILETLMPHKNISSQIIHITYLEKTNKLLLIGVKRVLINMKDIIYCFFEKQKSLLKLEDRTKRLEEECKRKQEQELKAEKYTFNIHPLLSGYLRGRGGSNIERVKRMFVNHNQNNESHSPSQQLQSQIIRIEPQNGSCYIAAKDKISLKQAVDQLQIVCKKVIIPKDEMGQIIGSQGKQIQDIKRKSQVIKVISWFKWPFEFETLKENQTRRYRTRDTGFANNQTEEGANSNKNNESNVPDIIKNATVDNIFDDNDIVDLSIGYDEIQMQPFQQQQLQTQEMDEEQAPNEEEDENDENNNNKKANQAKNNKNDALVIIGRKSRVELCIFMIEMTLNHFRQITKTRNNVRLLRQKINKIKGNPVPNYSNQSYYQNSYNNSYYQNSSRGYNDERGGYNRDYNRRNNRQYQSQRRDRDRDRDNAEQKENSPQKKQNQNQTQKQSKPRYQRADKKYVDKKYGDNKYQKPRYPRYQQRYQNGNTDNQYDNTQNVPEHNPKNISKKRKHKQRGKRKGKNTSNGAAQ